MATWVTHLMIADAVLKQLPQIHRRGFCVGNIAPDCNVENADWSAFTPSRTVTHWMQSERKSAADCEAFYSECIAKRADQIDSEEEYTFLLGYYYILARSVGKYYGAAISCGLTKQSKLITDNLGITLLPQAGVALGMALTATTLPDGALARNVVLFAVLVYELIGPALTKRSLLAAGEIKPEDRTSARRHNEPKMR